MELCSLFSLSIHLAMELCSLIAATVSTVTPAPTDIMPQINSISEFVSLVGLVKKAHEKEMIFYEPKRYEVMLNSK